jgi:hypothetical protein
MLFTQSLLSNGSTCYNIIQKLLHALGRDSTSGLLYSVVCFLCRHLQCIALSQSRTPCCVPCADLQYSGKSIFSWMDSSVGIATRIRTERLRNRRRIPRRVKSHFSIAFRPALGPIKPSVLWIFGAAFLGVKR